MVVKKKVGDQVEGAVEITPENIDDYLGVKRYRFGPARKKRIAWGKSPDSPGPRLAETLLTIEAVVMSGKGKAAYTGQLGDVMQESIQAAMTVVRARTSVLGVDEKFYQKRDIHIHVPEGATPKDGPSAGVGMCTAVVSALTGIAVRADVAMTGEITLRGEVLPVGGLKEKLLAALRGGIRLVLIPEENARELVEIPDDIKSNLDIRPVKWIDQVLDIALTRRTVRCGRVGGRGARGFFRFGWRGCGAQRSDNALIEFAQA